ncbi:Resolvase, N terminal domain [Olivibacter domesticus]|uniref:Resolvase, N terminal domain n=2 Tax=Olivibacter domesticus TaxID=407022 RepID=A0A1H7KM36_OLID1|nr:Resolvase, N terminal domain [Olivibacter domesticus]
MSATKNRPQFEKMIDQIRKGDVIAVWRIDRLGRTTLQLIKLMVELREKGVEFVSIKEGIDTRTQMGRVWFMLSSIFAENELEVLKERTKAGFASARARGRIGGRPKGLSEKAKKTASTAGALYKTNQLTTGEICSSLGIKSKATLYRYLRHEGVHIEGWTVSPKLKRD